jgi:hypothetical protein
MSENKSSVKCPACGMVNWATADGCKRCGEWFNVGDYARPDEVPPQPYGQQPYGEQQYGEQHYGQEQYGEQYYAPQQYGGQPSGSAYAQPYAQPYGQPHGEPGKRSVLPRVLVGLLVFVALAGTLGTVGVSSLLRSKPPEWRYYKSPRGNYSVRIPAEPVLDPPDLQLDPSLNFKSVGASLSRAEGCFVLYTDYPNSIEGITDSQLEEMAREVATATQSEVIEIQSVRLGSHRGVELLAKTSPSELRNGRAHWRVYLVGRRMYVLVLVGRDGGRLLTDRDEFFDSFSVPAAAEDGAAAQGE